MKKRKRDVHFYFAHWERKKKCKNEMADERQNALLNRVALQQFSQHNRESESIMFKYD